MPTQSLEYITGQLSLRPLTLQDEHTLCLARVADQAQRAAAMTHPADCSVLCDRENGWVGWWQVCSARSSKGPVRGLHRLSYVGYRPYSLRDLVPRDLWRARPMPAGGPRAGPTGESVQVRAKSGAPDLERGLTPKARAVG